jgi:hypothetical protein
MVLLELHSADLQNQLLVLLFACTCSANMTMKDVPSVTWEVPISMPCDIKGGYGAPDAL